MKLLVILSIIVLSGCSSLGLNLGSTEYTVEPVQLADGTIICCKAHLYNSKNYDKLKFTLKKNKDGTVEVALDEKGVNASDPASVAAENQTKLLEVVNKLIPAN